MKHGDIGGSRGRVPPMARPTHLLKRLALSKKFPGKQAWRKAGSQGL